MLVLSRKKGESILIGNDVIVTVERLSKSRVRLGIEAPKETKIVRVNLSEKQDVRTKTDE